MMAKKKKSRGLVTLEEAQEAMRRDPSGEAYAKLLVKRGQGVRAPLISNKHVPLPDLTRVEVVAAYNKDPSGAELAQLLSDRGVGVPLERNPPPRDIPFRPLPII